MKRRNIRNAAVVMGAIVTVAACGGSSGNGDSDADAPADNAPDEDATFVWADAADANDLHIAGLSDSTSRVKRDQIFEQPLRWALDDSGQAVLEGELATEWEFVDDLTLELKLREGVAFHNGAEFNADALKASWDYYLNEEIENYQLYQRYFSTVTEVEVVDEFTVRVHMSEPTPVMPSFLTTAPMVTAPEYLAEHGDDEAFLAENPVGTGPYMLESWTRGQEIVMTANPDHWEGEPEVDTLVFRAMPEIASRVSALLAGEVNMVPGIPLEMLDQLESDPEVNLVKVPLRRSPYVGLDNTNPGPTQSVEFRQALNYAVDWDTIIDTLLDGEVVRTPGPLNPLDTYFDPDLEPYPYDPAKAEELIRAAGFEPGDVSITLNYVPGRLAKDAEVVAAVAGYLEEVGVGVELVTHEWNTYLELMAKRELPNAHFLSRADSTLDGIEYMLKLSNPEDANTNFTDADLVQKLQDGMSVTDPAERKELAQQLQREMQQLASQIYGYQAIQYVGLDSRFEWDIDPFEQYSVSQINVVE